MARGSKKNTAQSNSAKGASAQRKKGRNDAEDRVALKDAPSRGRARARAVEEEAPFEEIDREPRIFDDRTKRDIAGVIAAVLAVVLFLAVVLQPSGFLTSALSSALHLSLGIGAYVLPFILVIVGASLIVRVDRADLPLRLGVGLAMLFFAFMSALSLLTPGASTNGAVLFDANVLASRGGYVGSGIAWALLQLFGEAVSIALLLGVALAGAVIIGFSLTGAFESLREKGSQFNARLRAARDAEDDELPGIPYEAADENDNPYAALDENRPQAQVEPPEARVPRREERGLLAGFGMTKKDAKLPLLRRLRKRPNERCRQHAFVVPGLCMCLVTFRALAAHRSRFRRNCLKAVVLARLLFPRSTPIGQLNTLSALPTMS